MNRNTFADRTVDDRADAPVVGTLLLVALVIVLATLVFSLFPGETTTAEPVMVGTFTVAYDHDGVARTFYRPSIDVTYESGPTLEAHDVYVVDASGNRVSWAELTGSGTITSGDVATVDGYEIDGELDGLCHTGQIYRVIWISEDGRSFVLATYDIPYDPVYAHSEIEEAVC